MPWRTKLTVVLPHFAPVWAKNWHYEISVPAGGSIQKGKAAEDLQLQMHNVNHIQAALLSIFIPLSLTIDSLKLLIIKTISDKML